MLLVRQPQLRFLVFHKCRQPDLPKPVSKVFKHKVEASLLISQDLQNSLNRIFGGLNTFLAPPRRGHPIFDILNEIRWERLAVLLRQASVVPPSHACDAVVNPKFDLVAFIQVHAVMLIHTAYLALGFRRSPQGPIRWRRYR
jgi:hypothetical protein